MLKTNPYLHFLGNAEQALHLYKSIFGGEIESILRYREMPGGEKLPAEDQEKVLHGTLNAKGIILMVSDYVNAMGNNLNTGNNFHICIHTENEAEVDRLVEGLAKGGKVEMPANKTFWGAYFAMCRDKFGVQWMITYDTAQ